RDQPADHQVLGRLVEHAAPAGVGRAARRARDPPHDPDSAPVDGLRLPAVLHPAGACAHPDRDRPSSLGDRGPDMSNHAAFSLSTYLAVFVILGGLTIASLRARYKTRRALAERGLERRR